MGKILDTLRQAAPAPAHLESRTVGAPPDENPPAVETPAEEEVPYIEVGPRRSFEASAAVLATLPERGHPRSATLRVGAAASATPPTIDREGAALQGPHNVLFRSLAVPSRFARELVAFHAAGQPVSAAYADLLQKIRETMARRSPEKAAVLLFTASRPRVGATTALLNVAITAARDGDTVVVIDANLRRAGVADRLGLEPAPGLTEVLAGDCSLADALRATEQPGLFILTAGGPTPTLASSEELRALLNELREDHGLVLLDAPHWDGRAGVAALAAACDAVFLVVSAPEADTPPASDLVRALPGQGVRLAGCILTPN
jgi:Mrp family chromosome partitioning ATPase